MWELEPEVPGGSNATPGMDQSVPPVGFELRFHFDTWLGDDLVTSHPCFLVTARLAEALEASDLSGWKLQRVEVTTSEGFEDLHPGWTRALPPFRWLQIGHDPSQDLHVPSGPHSSLGHVVVTNKALELLRRFSLRHCKVVRRFDEVRLLADLERMSDTQQGAFAAACAARQNATSGSVNDARSAASAARSAFEKLHEFVVRREQTEKTQRLPDWELDYFACAHPLVQAELARQRRDLDELRAGGPDDAVLVARVLDRASVEAAIFYRGAVTPYVVAVMGVLADAREPLDRYEVDRRLVDAAVVDRLSSWTVLDELAREGLASKLACASLARYCYELTSAGRAEANALFGV